MLCTLCYRAGTICQWEIDWRLALRRLRSEDIRKERAVVSDFDARAAGLSKVAGATTAVALALEGGFFVAYR